MIKNILFCHTGAQQWMYACVLQAVHMANGSDVIVIGDNDNKDLIDVKHFMLSDFKNSALWKNFVEVYFHMSPNPILYEVFCWERWFIIYEFCRQKNISEFMCIDSDLLIYSNPNNFNIDKFIKNGFAGNAFMLFVKNVEELERFLEWSISLYKDKRKAIEIATFIKKNNINYPVLSDMVGIMRFHKENQINYAGLFYENSIDTNISGRGHFKGIDEYVRDSDGLRKIVWENKSPFYERINVGLERVNAIHFQGPSKKHIINNVTFEKNEYYTLMRSKADSQKIAW
jgi:hypothetical protein